MDSPHEDSFGFCMDSQTVRVCRFDPGIAKELITVIRSNDHLPVVARWMTDDVLRLAGNDAAGKESHCGLPCELKQKVSQNIASDPNESIYRYSEAGAEAASE